MKEFFANDVNALLFGGIAFGVMSLYFWIKRRFVCDGTYVEKRYRDMLVLFIGCCAFLSIVSLLAYAGLRLGFLTLRV